MKLVDKNIKKIIWSDGTQFEYHNIDGFLTDNNAVFLEGVPENKVKEVLYTISDIICGFGFFYGTYSQLFEFRSK